jgi:hypothetical protein
VYTATIIGFLIAALGGMFLRGLARAFCAGAVLRRTVYLVLIHYGTTCNILLTDEFLRNAAEWPSFRWPSPPRAMAPPAAQVAYRDFINEYTVNWTGSGRKSGIGPSSPRTWARTRFAWPTTAWWTCG